MTREREKFMKGGIKLNDKARKNICVADRKRRMEEECL
jgi:hypothetical protein